LVLEQYLDYLAVLEEIDVNAAGDFITMASMLIEIKSFEVLPGEESVEEVTDDPRKELVEQLLEYKKFCDAANSLQIRSERWQLRFPRLANDLPPRPRNMAEEPIREAELWDLVSAFGRILRENSPKAKHEVIYDETPISTHMRRIYQRLKAEERIAFRQLFVPGQHKTSMVGVFLASLELVRHEYANVFQDGNFGEIELTCRQSTKPLDFALPDTVV
jgi:segregation and condensation protein A